MRIYRLDMARKNAGKTVPFDTVYMAFGEGRAVVKKLFAYALVMPVTGSLKQALGRVTAFPRTDTRSWQAELTARNDGVAVIPILPKRAKELMPTYLINKRWYCYKQTYLERKSLPVIPEMSYLQTPTENFRPVCIACPRFSEHMGGLCRLGEPVCYKTLVLGQVEPSESTDVPQDVREFTLGDSDVA